jgi:hypothetical protein
MSSPSIVPAHRLDRDICLTGAQGRASPAEWRIISYATVRRLNVLRYRGGGDFRTAEAMRISSRLIQFKSGRNLTDRYWRNPAVPETLAFGTIRR